ncbi:type VI secretion system Vgr family protein [Pseudomonas citri]|uniref:type VI secretion system Vgr family protein n=1 Tax=Pseudomonas citri TaxID=2978349 RepID=UPI0021B5E915|nr:type VI secretion system tip protein TssI/VgrG [Pseudomonas citri]
MHNDTESPFSLTLTQSDLQLQVLRLNGREALNQPYHFDLELISLGPPISADALLGQPAFLRLDGKSGVHGVLQSVSLSADASSRIGYHLTLVPYLQRLEQGPRRRVFHRLSVVEVLRRLLEEHALPPDSYRFELPHGHYPCRPFCIQYEESDLTLLQRLCEEEGIHYHFEHAFQGHVLVFAEDPKSFAAHPVELPLRPDNDRQPALQRLYQRHHSTLPGLPFRFRDRAGERSDDTAANQVFAEAAHEMIRADTAQAYRFQASRRNLERLRCQQRQIHGHSTHPALHSGQIVQIGDHPLTVFNDQWLVTEIQHQGRQFSILEPNLPATPPSTDYRNRFTAIAWSTVFRPGLRHPRPCIPGYHLAHVLGTTGQPAQLDEHGRVSVSLWTPGQEGLALPVSQQRLGEPPRLMAGSEVLVSFLDGDPDRPVLCAQPSTPDTGQGPARPRHNHDTGLLFDWLLNPPAP